MTKVLMISTDEKILDEESAVFRRMVEYSALFEELHIVIAMKRNFRSSFFSLKEPLKIGERAFAYPTNSLSKVTRPFGAYQMGGRILERKGTEGFIITSEDAFENGFAAWALSKRYKTPLHVQVHTDFLNPFFKKASLENRVRRAVSRIPIRGARAIRVVSERIKSSLRDPRAEVLPIWTDIEAIRQSPVPVGFKQTHMRFSRTVLAASRLTREKDLKTALRAFKEARQDYPTVGFLIIGEGPELKRLELLAHELGIEDWVRFEPWMEKNELISYMKTCDVFVSSSLYEGYGLSMLEAHVANATLAATDAGIAPLLAHDKCLAQPGNSESLAAALRNALSGSFKNKEYTYPFHSKEAYLESYKADIERSNIEQ